MALNSTTPGVYQKVSGTFTDDTGSLILPAGFQIISLLGREAAGKAVPGGVYFGTTLGGTEVGTMVALASTIEAFLLLTGASPISGANVVLANVVSAFSFSVDTPIYITAGTRLIGGVTQANPAVVSSVGHGFLNGQQVTISGVVGMTELNGNTYTVAGKSANAFQLSGINSTGYGAWVSGGTAGGWNGASVTATLQIAQFD